MNNKLLKLKQEFIYSIKNIDENWDTAVVYLQFPPFTNMGYMMQPNIFYNQNILYRVFKETEDFDTLFYDFWYETKEQYNEIVFKTKKDDYENATIEARFNQEVEDNFQNNLPKSKRGKTIPWWKNDKYKR